MKDDLFDVISGLNSPPIAKPDPSQLLYVMKKLKIRINETLFIGDSFVDEGAAQAAGVEFFKVALFRWRTEKCVLNQTFAQYAARFLGPS